MASSEVVVEIVKVDPRAFFADCAEHGRYQQNQFDADGFERFLPTCPKCFRAAQAREIMGRAAVPPRFLGRTLENFDAQTPGQREALSCAKAFASKFPEILSIGRSMLFHGAPGTGKTHLAAGIIAAVTEGGYTALYSTVIEAVRRVKETWGRDNEGSEREQISRFVKPDLLVLDEVGVQFGSETERLILFDIINGRYENMRPTILMSNLDVAGVEQNLGARAVDRLRENGGRVVVFNWESHRKTGKALANAAR